jgi:N-acetylglucosamine kinase-like BadF-type ATPase
MSVVIADSGSTGTDWAWLQNGKVPVRLKTAGLNPHFTTDEDCQRIAGIALQAWGGVEEVHFYGSGCGGVHTVGQVKAWLQTCFPQARLNVQNDLYGAAYACWGEDAGLIAILGTGANRAYYDGNQLVMGPPSLGYVLGDEGSGNHLGRLLLRAYFRKQLSPETSRALEAEYEVERETVLVQLYQKPNPSAYLASFAPFLAEHRHRPDIQALLNLAFGKFVDSALRPMLELSSRVALVGSIAHHFEPELRRALEKERMELDSVLAQPMDALIERHG